MAQKRVGMWKLSGCVAEPRGVGLSSRARIAAGLNSKLTITFLEVDAAVVDKDGPCGQRLALVLPDHPLVLRGFRQWCIESYVCFFL